MADRLLLFYSVRFDAVEIAVPGYQSCTHRCNFWSNSLLHKRRTYEPELRKGKPKRTVSALCPGLESNQHILANGRPACRQAGFEPAASTNSAELTFKFEL